MTKRAGKDKRKSLKDQVIFDFNPSDSSKSLRRRTGPSQPAPMSTIRDVSPKTIAWHRELIEIQTRREGSCWIWTKSLTWDGYAHTSFGGRSITVHRISYLIHKGDIPTGMVVRHCCPGGENRACVNPDHLVLGSKGDNNRDTISRGKGGKGGPKGHLPRSSRVDAGVLKSDVLIRSLAKNLFNAAEISRELGLPEDHIGDVLNAERDEQSHRPATRFERRFWSKVEKMRDCWLWQAMITAGYGRIRIGSRLIGAHQISWRLHYGPIDAGLVVCHNCLGGDNPRCVNPNHLYVASQTENLRDAAGKRARKRPLFQPDS